VETCKRFYEVEKPLMKRLLLAGAGHAHLMTIRNISAFTRTGVSVTVAGPGDFHYYSGMGPGLLSGIYRPEETRFDVRRMVEDRGGTFVRETVERIDAPNRRVILADGRTIAYNLLSCNLGSDVIALPGGSPQLSPVKPIDNLYRAGAGIRSRLKDGPLRVAIIGGGPAGVDLAGNLLRLGKTAANPLGVTLISRDDLLFRFPARARTLALSSLRQRGATVLERNPVRQVEASRIALEGGQVGGFRSGLQRLGHLSIKGFHTLRPAGFQRRRPAGESISAMRFRSDYFRRRRLHPF
jgi:NADH dehydrogenase FAD-containing subunit